MERGETIIILKSVMTTLNFQTSKKRIAASENQSPVSFPNLRQIIIPVISMAKSTAIHDEGIVNDLIINQSVMGKISQLLNNASSIVNIYIEKLTLNKMRVSDY